MKPSVVYVNLCREREPWGPGWWYAQLITSDRIVVDTTDFASSRTAATRAAEKLAASRGYEVR